MNQKKAIVLTLLVLVALTAFILLDNSKKKGSNAETLSQNILYITQPVTLFSGTVDKIEGNALTVSSQYSLPQTAPITVTVMPGQPVVMPTPKIIAVTYQVVVSGKTQINQPMSPIPYLFKTVTPGAPPTLTIKDIKVGHYIMVNGLTDLRTLAGNMFEATVINVPQKMNTLSGKIIRLNGNTFTLKAYQPTAMTPIAMGTAPSPAAEKEYTVTSTQDTEISRMVYSASMMTPGEPPTPPKTEKLALSDLKKDMQVTVYTDGDVTTQTKLTALRIEPVMPPPIMPTPAPVVNVPITPTP